MIECLCEVEGSLLSCSVLLINMSLVAINMGGRKEDEAKIMKPGTYFSINLCRLRIKWQERHHEFFQP